MTDSGLRLPPRSTKPRENGVTMMIDGGLPTGLFADTLESHADLVDVVKFGWGTSIVTKHIRRKVDAARANGVDFYFGGTLFEKFLVQGRVDDWRRFVDGFGATTIEISNGTIDLANADKAGWVARFAADYRVLSEVGFKDTARADGMGANEWLADIREDLSAGAAKVITEARESGTSGLADASGKLRLDILDHILSSGIALESLMFEAPTKALQTYLVTRVGSDVNLGNIAPADLVPLETLRLGLRGDTLMIMEGQNHA
jgi:phosphosulfolactate synthase